MQERILQFGEGNFLRGFVDYFINGLNEKANFDTSVILVQPLAQGMGEVINAQGGKYTTILRGKQNGELVEEITKNTAVSRCINPYAEFDAFLEIANKPELQFVISNTTEAGIAFDDSCKIDDMPAVSFPGKVTQFLYARYKAFNGAMDKGLIFIACELIDFNGRALKKCVMQYIDLWKLEDGFKAWVENACTFASSLVDRIVTGFPRGEEAAWKERLGYEDKLMVTAEYFHLWVIEGMNDKKDLLPLDKYGYNVVFTDDIVPYKKRKVRILNGAHTMSVMAAHLCGLETVKEMMDDEIMGKYVRKGIFEEVIPTIDGLSKAELEDFAGSVMERFENPYIRHRLLDICLNSTAKYKERVLPSLLGAIENGTSSKILTFSLAALVMFYKTDKANDMPAALEFMKGATTKEVLANAEMWGQDLTKVDGLLEAVEGYIADCAERPIREVIAELVEA